jgi:transposase
VRVKVPHPTHKDGDCCPGCGKGKLRRQKKPATVVTVSAQPPVGAEIHEMERLRCDGCGTVFTAATPADLPAEKYDVNVGVIVGILRYGGGMPFLRLERLQESVGVPLPSSIQWEQANRAAEALDPVVDHLIYLGAQAATIYTDDTTMRVRTLRQEIQAETDPKRTGIFTTGIVCEAGEHPIRLFFTGRRHAGENLARVLDQRESGLAPPLHMSDGLDRNEPKGHVTRPCKCGVHARRNFVEVQGAFPEQCQKVVESFAAIYRVEARSRDERLDPEARLKLHQAESRPVMDQLKSWFTGQLDDKKVEPNSGLGRAMSYMLDRWEPLTRFLVVPGAPLDNNISERLLKTSILHRKNSLHYRTTRGAEVGDVFMSVIQTCVANRTNPFDYMVAVVKNQRAVKEDPGRWMPWNYQETLATATQNSRSG